MKNKENNNFDKHMRKAMQYLSDMKRKLYNNPTAAKFMNVIRVILGIVLIVIAAYFGIQMLAYALLLGIIVIAVYFLFPREYVEEKLSAVAENFQGKTPVKSKSVPSKKVPAKKTVKAKTKTNKKPAAKKSSPKKTTAK